jgi:hypothetical protein
VEHTFLPCNWSIIAMSTELPKGDAEGANRIMAGALVVSTFPMEFQQTPPSRPLLTAPSVCGSRTFPLDTRRTR